MNSKYFNITTAATVVATMYLMALISAAVPSLAPGAIAAKLLPAKSS